MCDIKTSYVSRHAFICATPFDHIIVFFQQCRHWLLAHGRELALWITRQSEARLDYSTTHIYAHTLRQELTTQPKSSRQQQGFAYKACLELKTGACSNKALHTKPCLQAPPPRLLNSTITSKIIFFGCK